MMLVETLLTGVTKDLVGGGMVIKIVLIMVIQLTSVLTDNRGCIGKARMSELVNFV